MRMNVWPGDELHATGFDMFLGEQPIFAVIYLKSDMVQPYISPMFRVGCGQSRFNGIFSQLE